MSLIPLKPSEKGVPPDCYYAIGDIHGRLDLLDNLLESIFEDSHGKNFQIVFLGDYVDRGPQSRDVIDRLISLKEQYPQTVIILLGNHDRTLLELVETDVTPDLVLTFNLMASSKNGFLETVKSYGIDVDLNNYIPDQIILSLKKQFPSGHLRFLRHAWLSYDTDAAFFSHAGIDFDVPLERQTEQTLLWGTSRMFSQSCAHEKWIVHGHWGTRGKEVQQKRICVDSGAVWTDTLTACVIEGDQIRFLSTSPETPPRESVCPLNIAIP